MKKRILLVLLVFMISGVAAEGVGVAPSYRDLGTIERGETQTFEFYVSTTGYTENLTISPEIGSPLGSTLFGDASPVDSSQVSEEDIDDWFTFSRESYTINPRTQQSYEVGSSSITAAAKMEVDITVPRDAEPGVHVASVGLSPGGPDGESVSFAARGVSTPQVSFTVPGNAQRQLRIVDTQAVRIGENRVQIIQTVRNDGTVTVSTQGNKRADVLTQDNAREGEFTYGSVKIAPGDTAQISSIWSDEDLDGGIYKVDGTMNYMTGQAFMGDTFSVSDAIQERISINNTDPDSEDEEGQGFPTWLVLMALVLTGAILYGFEIDPLWILMIVGILGITMFVLMSGLPIYLIAVLLMLSVGLIYYGI